MSAENGESRYYQNVLLRLDRAGSRRRIRLHAGDPPYRGLRCHRPSLDQMDSGEMVSELYMSVECFMYLIRDCFAVYGCPIARVQSVMLAFWAPADRVTRVGHPRFRTRALRWCVVWWLIELIIFVVLIVAFVRDPIPIVGLGFYGYRIVWPTGSVDQRHDLGTLGDPFPLQPS